MLLQVNAESYAQTYRRWLCYHKALAGNFTASESIKISFEDLQTNFHSFVASSSFTKSMRSKSWRLPTAQGQNVEEVFEQAESVAQSHVSSRCLHTYSVNIHALLQPRRQMLEVI